MAVPISVHQWPSCTYRVRYAQSHESIFQAPGWQRFIHRFWALDVGPRHGTVRVAGKRISRNRDSVMLYAPGTRYEEHHEVGRLVSWSWLLLEEKGTPSLLASLVGPQGFRLFEDPGGMIRSQIRQLVDLARSRSPSNAHFLVATLHDILGRLHSNAGPFTNPSHSSKTPDPLSSPVHPWRRHTWEALDDNKGRLTAPELAAILGVSLSTLNHQYRKLCGEPFKETVQQWRMESVRALLKRRELSLKEIAAESGFSHQSHLSAFFKNHTGVSPSVFRQHSPR